jgi:transcriptional regulator with XRE-family HTH domain
MNGSKPRAPTGPAPAYVLVLRDARVARGWTQEDLADALGWSRSRIAEIEAANARVHPRFIAAWAAVLGHIVTAVPIDITDDTEGSE